METRRGGRSDGLRAIAVIQDRGVIVKILEHLGLPSEEPRARRANSVGWDDSS